MTGTAPTPTPSPQMPEQWPPGKVLTAAREKLGISKRAAARKADLSDARWRQLESGYILVKREWHPITTPPETLIRAADAVGANVKEVLHAAGLSPEDVRKVDARQELIALIEGLNDLEVASVRGYVSALLSARP